MHCVDKAAASVGTITSIEACLITANHAGHSGGIAAISSLLSIASSEITGNTADLAGGGIALLASEAFIDGTTIHGSAAPLGAGLWLDATSAAQVSATTVCDNQPDQIAGAWQDLGGNAPCSCIGDLNEDGVVGGSDLAAILPAWSGCPSPTFTPPRVIHRKHTQAPIIRPRCRKPPAFAESDQAS